MKKLGIMIAIALIAISGTVYAASKMTLMVNGSVLKADVKVINGVTYVPLRAAGEALNAQINYDSKTKTVSIIGKQPATSNNSTTTTTTNTEPAPEPLVEVPPGAYNVNNIVFSQLTVKKDTFLMDIDVNITNYTKTDLAYTSFTAVFYDKNGARIGTARGSFSELKKNQTRTESLFSSDDFDTYDTVKFQLN